MTAGVVALAMVTGTVVSAWQAMRATQAEGLAQTRLQAETEARNATGEQLRLTQKAEEKARQDLYRALVAQAHASRMSQRMGQRFDTLRALTEAARMARDMKLPEEEFLKLRNEAIACLALPDVRVAREWDGWPAGSFSVDFADSLERYARVDHQGAVSIRRVAGDIQIASLPEMGRESWPVFSPDGQFLALFRSNKWFQVWNLAAPAPAKLLDGPMDTFAFSPDSRQLAQALPDGSLCLYDLPSGRQIRQLAGSPGVHHLAFHPKEQQLAVSRATGVQVRDVETGRVVAELAQPSRPYYLAWHPNGKTLAVAAADRNIHIWDVATRKPIARLPGHKSDGITFAFNHAGDLLASTCWDGRLRLWDPRTGQELFSTQADWPKCLRFSADDRLLAAGIPGEKLRIWEDASPGYRTLVRGPLVAGDVYHGSAIHPDGRLLAVVMWKGTGFWDLASGDHLGTIRLAFGNRSLLFEPSGALVTNGPGGLHRWPVQAGPASAEVLRIGPPQALPAPGSANSIAQSQDGRVLATTHGLVLHRDRPGQPVPLGGHYDVRYVAVSPNGSLVATGSHLGTKVKVWQALSGKLEKELPVEDGSGVCFSPDGKWLATTGGGCRLWAVQGWAPGPKIGGAFCAFSSDSRLLAVETGYGLVRLVDPDTGREYAQLEDPNQDRAATSFSPDGTRLVTTNHDDSNSVHVWDLRAIREELAKLGLDWELPLYPPAHEMKNPPPLQVTVDLGPLAPETPDRAVLKYSLAIAFMPLNPEAYLRRGRAYYQQTQWRKAADDLGLAVALNPAINHSQVWFELGYACSQANGAKSAIAAYSRYIELNPKGDGAWNNRGLLYAGLGELDKAASDYSRAVELNPKNGTAWNNRSHVNARLARWQEVVTDCSQFLELARGAAQLEAYYHRAGAYVQLARYREARADYEKALELGPSSPLLNNELAWLLANCPDAKVRDPSRSTQLAQRAIGLAEQVGNVWNTLGVAQYRAGNCQAAVKALEKSMLLRKGGDAFDFYFLAMAHGRLGNKDEALKWHGKAVTWVQKNEEALKKDRIHAAELRRFRLEAEELLELKK